MNRIIFVLKKRKLNKWYLKKQKKEKYCFFCSSFIQSPKLSYVDFKIFKVFDEIYNICIDCIDQINKVEFE